MLLYSPLSIYKYSYLCLRVLRSDGKPTAEETSPSSQPVGEEFEEELRFCADGLLIRHVQKKQHKKTKTQKELMLCLRRSSYFFPHKIARSFHNFALVFQTSISPSNTSACADLVVPFGVDMPLDVG